MKKKESIAITAIKKVVEKTLVNDANRTSCTIIYQPKAPTKLDSFKKDNK